MKTKKSFIATLMALPLAAASFTACTSETEDIQMTDAVGISVQMAGATATRAAYTPAAGTALTLHYGTADGTTKSDYTYTNGSWRSSNTLYWQQLSAVNSAYPFFATSPAEPGASGSVSADQSEGYTADDLLMAYTAASYKSTVALELQHLMGMIEVNLSNGGGMTDAELATATLAIDGVKTAYTTTHNAAAVSTLTASGDAANGLKPYQNGTLFQYVAPAQTWTAGALKMHVTLTINTTPVTYTYATAAEHSLVAGKKTVFNLTVSKTAIEANVTVADWVTNASAEGDMTIKPIMPNTPGGITAAESDILTLNYISGGTAADALHSATYTYSSNEWITDAPLYWENIAREGYTKTFTALYVPASGTDYYYGIASDIEYGAAIAFSDLKHAMAKMTITLENGENVTEEELKTIAGTILLTTLADGFEPNINTDGTTNITLAEDAKAISFTSGEAFYIAPQALADENVITLTRENGNQYTLKLKTLTDASGNAIFGTDGIEAGQHYNITLTVNETAVGVSAELAPWTEKTGTGTMTPEL